MQPRIVRPLVGGIGRLASARRRASRHDLVLAAIPAALLLAALASAVLPVPPATAAAGAGLSGLAVLDALFLNPPRGRGPGVRPS